MFSTSSVPRTRQQPVLQNDYDVIVVGGGPAGATVATLVAEYGHRVLLLEREESPRFHVGESLVPETYWTLKRLGVLDWLRKSGSPKKHSVQFVTESGKVTAPFYFDDYKQHESSQTWQVVRGEFDAMLLDNAESKGAVVRTDAQLRDVIFEEGRAVGVRVRLLSEKKSSAKNNENSVREIRSQVVVDATGQSAFLATRLGLKVTDPQLKMGSVWSYFKGAQRDEGRDEGATIIMQTAEKRSWFWYIPLANDVVSVGCTGRISDLFTAETRGQSEQIFQNELARCSAMQQRLASGTRCTDYFVTRDYSYRSSQAAGDGWVLVGDAFGFIDPVYSTGVFLALKSGEFAADAIHAALVQNDCSAAMLGCWQEKYTTGLELFKKLVLTFYQPGFSFGTFLRDYPQYRSNVIDILIGDVYKPGVGEMFDVIDF